MYNYLVFLSFFQSVLGFILMTSSIMRFREPFIKRVITGLLAMLAGISILSYILYTRGRESVDGVAILIVMAIQLSWFLICSKDSFFVSFFSFLSFVNVYISISYVSDQLSDNAQGWGFVLERILIRLLIYIIILPLLFKYVRPFFRRLVEILDKEWRAATLVPLIFLIMQIMILYYPRPYWRWSDSSWYRVIIIVLYFLFLAVYYLLFTQAKGIIEKYALEKKQLLMVQQEKLWESELTRQKAFADLASQQRHDMHHHNMVIMEMLKKGHTEELKKYMRKMNDGLDIHKDNLFCSNPIANSICNAYACKAEKENIKMVCHVSIPDEIGIANTDLTCVLGNSLENAIEGCLRLPKHEKKEILFTAKYIDHRLRIQVQNTCLPGIKFKDGLPITQKKEGGTGTRSIRYTVENYDGTVGFSSKDGIFIAQIVLNANEEIRQRVQ